MFWFVWSCIVFAIEGELDCSFLLATMLSWVNPVGGCFPYSCVLFSLLVFAPDRRYSKFNSSVRLMYIAIVVSALSTFDDNVFSVFC